VYRTGARFTVEHITGSGGTGDPLRCVLFGGSPLSEKRHIYWNFVSSSLARIEQAKADWREGRFPAVPGETEFIPLPFD
jgi:hypothetical protein